MFVGGTGVAVGGTGVSGGGAGVVAVRVGVRVRVDEGRTIRIVGVTVMVSVGVGVGVGSSVAVTVCVGVTVGVNVGGSGVGVQVGGRARKTVVLVGVPANSGCVGGKGFMGLAGLTKTIAKALSNPKMPARTRTVRKFQVFSFIFDFLIIALPTWSFTQGARVMPVYTTLNACQQILGRYLSTRGWGLVLAACYNPS